MAGFGYMKRGDRYVALGDDGVTEMPASTFRPEAYMQEAATNRSPIDVSMGATQDEILTEEAKQTADRYNDPALAWFDFDPIDPELFSLAKDDGAIDEFEEAFVRGTSGYQKPQSLDKYMEMGNKWIAINPRLASYYKKRMLDSMPKDLKEEFEERMLTAKTYKDTYRRMDIAKIQQEVLGPFYAAQGMGIGLDGKPFDATKREGIQQKAIDSQNKAMSSAIEKYFEYQERYDDEQDPKKKAFLGRVLKNYEQALERSLPSEAEPDTTVGAATSGYQGISPRESSLLPMEDMIAEGARAKEARLAATPGEQGPAEAPAQEDIAVYQWAIQNEGDPRAQRVLQTLQAKYGSL